MCMGICGFTNSSKSPFDILLLFFLKYNRKREENTFIQEKSTLLYLILILNITQGWKNVEEYGKMDK